MLRAKALVDGGIQWPLTFDAVASLRYAKMAASWRPRSMTIATAALAAVVVASVNGLAGRNDEAEGERALCLARQEPDPLLVCEGLIAVDLSTVDGPGRPSENARHRAALEELLAVAEANGDIGFSLAAHSNLSLTASSTTTPGLSSPCRKAGGAGLGTGGEERLIDRRLGELSFLEGEYPGSLVLQRRVFEQARRQDLSMYLADVATEVASVVLKLGRDDAVARACTVLPRTSSKLPASVGVCEATLTRRRI